MTSPVISSGDLARVLVVLLLPPACFAGPTDFHWGQGNGEPFEFSILNIPYGLLATSMPSAKEVNGIKQISPPSLKKHYCFTPNYVLTGIPLIQKSEHPSTADVLQSPRLTTE